MPKRKKRLIGIFVVIAISAGALVIFIRQHYVLPIIMYHSVNPAADPKNRLAVSAATFERQMRFLKKHHYNAVPLEDLVSLIKEKKKIPPRTVAITFDDGYRDVYLYAFPVLKKYNLPATVFVIIQEIGRAQNDRLSWEEIIRMRDSGLIAFGSHGLGPEPLINLKSEEQVKREIFDSKRMLEEKLAPQPATLFSYPQGRFNAKIRGLVIAAGYRLAVSTNPGRNYPSDDIFALKRLRISENAGNLFVFWVETSGFYTFMKERRHK